MNIIKWIPPNLSNELSREFPDGAPILPMADGSIHILDEKRRPVIIVPPGSSILFEYDVHPILDAHNVEAPEKSESVKTEVVQKVEAPLPVRPSKLPFYPPVPGAGRPADASREETQEIPIPGIVSTGVTVRPLMQQGAAHGPNSLLSNLRTQSKTVRSKNGNTLVK
jgi:hypothetical protein